MPSAATPTTALRLVRNFMHSSQNGLKRSSTPRTRRIHCPTMPANARLPVTLLVAVAAILVWSGIAPHDRTTWWLEVFPVLLAVPILAATFRRFPLTRLAYVLIALHAVVLMVGGHYPYAEVPLGFWVRDALHLTRNHYDRLGHFMQG